MAETVSRNAARSNAFLLPNRSVMVPEIIQPSMVPSRADETSHPSNAGVSWKCACKNELQPEIIAVSYPNRKPPMVETKLMAIKYRDDLFPRINTDNNVLAGKILFPNL